jgi:hypothetical protein
MEKQNSDVVIRRSSIVFDFKELMKREFETIISARPVISKELLRCDIACVELLFRNGKIVEKMKERGEFLLDKNQEKVEEIDEEMRALISEEKNDLSFPVEAFITFESEEGYLRAMNLSKKKICFIS